MYYEEKIIKGIMHYRTNPEKEWIPYTIEQISKRYEDMKENYSKAYKRIINAQEALTGKE